jgi:hypothetical protein
MVVYLGWFGALSEIIPFDPSEPREVSLGFSGNLFYYTLNTGLKPVYVSVRTSLTIPANPGTCEPWHSSTGITCLEARASVCPRQTDRAPDTECARTRRYVYSMQAAPGAAPCLSLYHGAYQIPFSPAGPWPPGRRRPRMGDAAHAAPCPWSRPRRPDAQGRAPR